MLEDSDQKTTSGELRKTGLVHARGLDQKTTSG
jgi:hypothetical protein